MHWRSPTEARLLEVGDVSRVGDTITRVGQEYGMELSANNEWIWKNGKLTVLDCERKEFQTCIVAELNILAQFLPSSPAEWMPFLPGMPERSSFDEWRFELQEERNDSYLVEAWPLSEELKKKFQSCELLIRRADFQLMAVKNRIRGGHREIVYVFHQVDFTREPLITPQLDCYRNQVQRNPIKPEDGTRLTEKFLVSLGLRALFTLVSMP
ncbi:hypothetical protein [Rubinisphaera margarita]|uniref:hypothetical protein n=1 Tax=Rubinisphaera margarita TaxID=2909586 RepID=UPI001EE90C38|nr:hypothetical protein [Rubinisphaera margarita]MCG6156900.1 hypothetical protein [Rubinisphaera margarita]